MNAAIYKENGTLVIDFVKWDTTSFHRNVEIKFGTGDTITVSGDKPKRDIFYDFHFSKDAVDVHDESKFDLFLPECIEEYITPVLSWWERPIGKDSKKWGIARKLKRIKLCVFVEYKKGTVSKKYTTTKFLIIENAK